MKHYQNHVAVWMDHSQAQLIYPQQKGGYSIEKLFSPHDTHPREDGQSATHTSLGAKRESNNEYASHNKEKEQLHTYYHTLQQVLQKYDEILLFGPTKAKEEFFNLLMENKSFNGKRIEVESSDKMSEAQLIAYARKYFATTV